MNHDIRMPLGLTFLCTGLLLASYGLLTQGSTMYAASDGINLNLVWGATLAVFGGVMLAFSLRQRASRSSRGRPADEVRRNK